MNKTYRILSLLILSSTLITTATENAQQNTPEAISINTKTTTLQNAWQNKWVKAGTISTACAILYAVGVRYNVVPAPSLQTLSLVALPVIGKKAIDGNIPSSDNQQNDTATIATTDNNQEITTEPTVAPQDEQSTETKNEKKITLPSIDDMLKATDALKEWFIVGVHNYSPDSQEDYR